MSWAQRSAANLLPLSVEQRQFPVALHEWVYAGDMYDMERPAGTCELCEHPDIRYHFKIVNRHNGNEMLVGSECINRFGISATDPLGNVLNREESRRRVNRDRRYLVNEAKKRKLVNTLVELANVDEQFNIQSFISYVMERDAFTPDQLAVLFWRLDEHHIPYTATDFKLIIRRDREKAQLRRMPTWKIKKLWVALSTSQRRWVEENTGYEP
ncbi:hypothetical protein [Burkholderia cepacia]|uniref:hypothetical protein n=1 Tax=Burkholderia cepacia TaxID=292 RepID=UPI001C93DDAE|nr:hypothetical protein [Burkholderia cepacia]MBY4804632.1 hypothetical protein [Burkholderia cepacia]MCA8326734.1 hypothetical protein [Burkholderia cepacia]